MENTSPLHYSIHIEPDLRRFQFTGSLLLKLNMEEPADSITLNVLELAVWSCLIDDEGEKRSCRFSVDTEKEELTVHLPGSRSGELSLEIEYAGYINDKMAGFYRSRYEKDGETKYLAVTQFEESDARRAFPCFDHPRYKAVFYIEMVIDRNLEAIANGPVEREEDREDGKKLVKFQATPKMSTYLVFFGVGEFDIVEEQRKTLYRVAAVPGNGKYGGFGLEFGWKSLEYCEDFFDIPYVFPKLDLIAVPDFAFGAMENWGAITFRENLLLHYPGITSRAGELRICEVVAHEVVHQWFGDLVTPSDWMYLWLNESFATFFAYGIVDHYYPEREVWQEFIDSQTDRALERDGLLKSTPIEIGGGAHVIINASTAPIIYSKGGSVLRQIKGYLGDDGFRRGLRHFLKKFEYGCAASHDLWEALESASEKPITRIMKSWIEQEGHPVVRIRRNGSKLHFSQKRFTFLPNDSEQLWSVPITVRVFGAGGGERTLTTLLEDSDGDMEVGDAAVCKVNDGQAGFYRVMYESSEDLEGLGEKISGKQLSSEDRWGVQNDLYAFVRSGDYSLAEYLAFLSHYEEEDAFLPLTSIAENLYNAFLVLKSPLRETVAERGKSLIELALGRIGFEPASGEMPAVTTLRDRLLFPAALFGSKKTADFAADSFAALERGDAIHADIRKSVMQIGALNGGGEALDWLTRQFKTAESEHERMNVLAAISRFRERELIEKALRFSLEEVPGRNRYIPVAGMGSNPGAASFLWDWYTENIEPLEALHPIHYERVVAGVVPVAGMDREEEIKTFFQDEARRGKISEDVLGLALEKLAINSRMRDTGT